MMKVVGIAMLLMVIATTAVHLGLAPAVAQVMNKAMRCHKCLSFWLTLVGLWLIGCNMIIAVLLALFSAYLSYWYGVVLVILNKIYEKVWEKVNRKSRR